VWNEPVGVGEGSLTFDCTIRLRVLVPVHQAEIFEISVWVTGRFVSHSEVDESAADQFAKASGIFILWPYARVYCGELARLGGVAAPPLPLVVRPQGGRLELPSA